MQRIDRSLSAYTKQKIADSMRRYHANQTEAQKQETALKRSEALKRYWSGIPQKKDNETTVQDIVL